MCASAGHNGAMGRHTDPVEQMLRYHLRDRGIIDERVLRAMAQVPREEFVPSSLRAEAYADHPLPLAQGQTISQPFIVALTLQAAALEPSDTVLDVGTGSGYAAAVASLLAETVVTIERFDSLAQSAEETLQRLGYSNVLSVVGDGSRGCPEHAPYDAIVSAAAAENVPDAWCTQLAPRGRIVAPVGGTWGQRLRVLRADGSKEKDLGGVRFVPLISDESVGPPHDA